MNNGDGRSIRILLVEDSPTDARLLTHSLGELPGAGFEVTWTERIGDAVGLLRDRAFDIGLLDLKLPDSTDVPTYVRIHEVAPGLPTVVLTGAADEAAGAAAIRSGVQDFLVKGSLNGKALARVIRYAIERKHAEEKSHRLDAELVKHMAELVEVNHELEASRRAALNLMDDALIARRKAEEATRAIHKLNQTFKALGRSGQTMVRAQDEQAYLEEVCSIIIEDCGHAMVWMGFAEEDEGKTVRPVAHAGFDQGYLESLRISWADTERGRGPTGTAIRTGEMCLCRDMLTDPQFAPWRDEALRRGYASSVVLPLKANGKVFGAISIYSRESDPFTQDEIRLLLEIANDLSHGITAIRLRHQLHRRAQELAVANRELESFSYSISHDLRSPLLAIKGFSGILLEEYSDRLDDQGRVFLDRIMSGTDRMSALIDAMLSLSKLSRQELRPQDVNLSAIAQSVVAELRHGEPQRSVEAVIAPQVTAYGDARLLGVVLSNLLGNAWKYTGKTPGARIEFGTRQQDGETVCFVRDNGAGFDMTQKQRLFAPFQRLHSESQFSGTGIGLAIAGKVIQLHNGRIWGEGEIGKGATFYFTVSTDGS